MESWSYRNNGITLRSSYFLTAPKLGDGLVGVETILEHADYGRTLLSFHGGLIKQISNRRMGNPVSKFKFKLNS